MRALLLAGVVAFGWAGVAHATTETLNISFEGKNNYLTNGNGSITFNVTGLPVNVQDVTGFSFSYLLASEDYTYATFMANLDDLASFYLSSANEMDAVFSLTTNGISGNPSYYYDETITLGGTLNNATGEVDTIYGYNVNNPNVTLAYALTDVPEPASLALLGMGAAGIIAARRRRVA